MSYEIIPTEYFGKKLKKLQKKYPHIGADVKNLCNNIDISIAGGDALGKDCHKIRMKITDKNSGKSGGARVILQAKIIQQKVYLLTIYDKGDQESITDNEVDRLLSQL